MADILLELPDDLKAKAKTEADRLTLSLNGWIRMVIIGALEPEGNSRPDTRTG